MVGEDSATMKGDAFAIWDSEAATVAWNAPGAQKTLATATEYVNPTHFARAGPRPNGIKRRQNTL